MLTIAPVVPPMAIAKPHQGPLQASRKSIDFMSGWISSETYTLLHQQAPRFGLANVVHQILTTGTFRSSYDHAHYYHLTLAFEARDVEYIHNLPRRLVAYLMTILWDPALQRVQPVDCCMTSRVTFCFSDFVFGSYRCQA